MFESFEGERLQGWIVAAAEGRIAAPRGDASPWDAFYAAYESGSVEERARVDAAFQAFAAAPSPDVREAVVEHGFALEAEPGVAWARMLLEEHARLYADQRPSGGFSLRARVLDVLAAQGPGADPDGAAALIVRYAVEAGPLTSRVGSFFGTLDPDALDALVRAAPAENLLKVVENAAYLLCRDPVVAASMEARVQGWPERLQSAYAAGVTAYRAWASR